MSLRRFFRRSEDDADLMHELDLHVAEEIEENIARGMAPPEARRQALVKLGNPERVREDLWKQNTLIFADNLWRDLKYAARTLSRSPGFTMVSLVVMSLGIGANIALFTIVRSVLLKPLPFQEPARLVRLYERGSDNESPFRGIAGGVFAAWKRQSHGFSSLALFGTGLGYSLSEAGGQLPEKVTFGVCSWNLFPTLGVEPALGRGFTASDDQPSANATAILTWGLWKRRFGGDPSVLNRTIHLDGKPYTIVGIMPPWFAYPALDVQLWTPIHHEVPGEEMQALDSHDWVAIGRLTSGVSEAQATSELSLIVRRLRDQHLDDPFISQAANSRPLLKDMVGDVATPLYVLFGATGCLLLIACLNIASLWIARGAARRRELAIRAALGGGRWRLVREHLTENLLLSAASGALGLFTAHASVQWFVRSRQDMTRVEAIHMDGMVVAFALGLVVLCAVFAGVTSLVSLKSEPILNSLRDFSRSHSEGHQRVQLRKWLLSLEVGLTVVLLVATGLLLKSYRQLRFSDLGCATGNVLTMQFSLPDSKYNNSVQRVNFFADLLARVRALPGVDAAGLVRAVPGQGYGGDAGFAIAENPPLPAGQIQAAIVRWADPGYFRTMGIPLARGNIFDDSQRLERANRVVISESFARQYFGNEDPIGKHLLTLGHNSFEIAGIVGDTRFTVSKPPQPTMYFSIYSGEFGSTALVIRSALDLGTLALPTQRIVQQIDPELAAMDILTMNQIIGRDTLDASFDATLLLVFSGLSLLLAAVGLFGVLSYSAAQRTTEMGIRIALGAQRDQVLRRILGEGLRPAVVGLGLGLLASTGVTRLVQSMLYQTRPLDPIVFLWVTATLLLVAAAACVLPAWRTSRLDPMRTLRSD
jgi:putative ABC transport system permease protein